MQTPSDINHYLASVKTGKVLDISTGTGRFLKTLKENLQEYDSIIGIDPDENVLKEAVQLFPEKNIHFAPMQAQKLEFEDHTFDMVAISRGLHHLANLKAAIQEMVRVLKPGGLLIIHEMYPDVETPSQESQVLMHHYRVDLDKLLGVEHFYTYPRATILRFFDLPGLTTETMMDYVPVDMREMATRLEEYAGDLNKLERMPEYPTLKMRLEELRERVQKIGVSNPPHLFLVKRKV